MVKAILSIDNNHFYLDPTKPTLSLFVVTYFNLEVGDKVIGYEDDQEWEGSVGFDPSYPEEMEWYLDLRNSVNRIVSHERMIGRNEGSSASMPYGEIRGKLDVAELMIADGMDIEMVMKYTGLSRRRLEHITKKIIEGENMQLG